MTCEDPASMNTNDDGSWRSVCGCGVVCCESGTYEEAADALNTHRDGEAP